MNIKIQIEINDKFLNFFIGMTLIMVSASPIICAVIHLADKF